MSWARLWLVAYDVAHPKRLRRVAKLLESVGERQQKSVFELAAGPDERQRITRRLAAIISPEEDQVLLHPLLRAVPCRHTLARPAPRARP